MSEKPTYEELEQRVRELERAESERRQAEMALRDREHRLRSLFEGVPIGLYRTDLEGGIVDANPALLKMLGFPDLESLQEFSSTELMVKPEVQTEIRSILEQQGEIHGHEFQLYRRDGSTLWVRDSARSVRGQDGRVLYEGSLADITERKQSEERSAMMAEMIDAAPGSITVHDLEGRFLYANRKTFDMYGYDEGEFMDISLPDLDAPESAALIGERMRQVIEEGEAQFEVVHLRKDGTGFPLALVAKAFEWYGKPAVLSIASDITEREHAERERERLLSAMEQAAEVMVITDPDGAIQYVNPAFEHVTGYSAEEVWGQNPRILKSGEHDEAFYRELWQTIKGGKTWRGRFTNRRKDGALYTEKASISPVMDETGRINNFVAVKRDITSEINLETRLAQAQKMEAIGTLAGGIAHDFNNILSAIMGYSEMARVELPGGGHADHCIEQVLLASHRARDLVKQILAFSRISEEEMQPLKTGLLLKEAVKLLRASLPSTIEMRTEISASKDTILANATQIHQVVMNLCTNAYHAMHDSGGILEVSLKDVEMDAPAAAVDADLGPGRYLLLSISDTGHGMSPEVMERIFDPYFTTKEKEVGTGLGLSVVHGIVKRHGGTIRVRSRAGKGTTFDVLIPTLDEKVGVSAGNAEAVPKGTGRILFVDDEASITDIGRQILRRQGYDVEVATSSIEALECFKSRPDDFDLVITDMTMPHLRGDALAEAVMQIRPDMPVILCTGYSDMMNEKRAGEMGIRATLEKPISTFEMARVVHDVLSGGDQGSGDG